MLFAFPHLRVCVCKISLLPHSECLTVRVEVLDSVTWETPIDKMWRHIFRTKRGFRVPQASITPCVCVNCLAVCIAWLCVVYFRS